MSNEDLESQLAAALSRIDALQQQINGLSTRLGGITADYSLMHGVFPSLFPAAVSGSTFTEKSVGGGALVTRPAPARSGSFITLGSGDAVLLGSRDIVGGEQVMSYVKIGGSNFDVRWDATSKSLQKTTVADPEESDWTTIVTFAPVCGS